MNTGLRIGAVGWRPHAAEFLARADELEKVGKPVFEIGRLSQYGAHEHAVFLDAAAFNAAMAPLLRARAELVLAMKRAEAAAVLQTRGGSQSRV